NGEQNRNLWGYNSIAFGAPKAAYAAAGADHGQLVEFREMVRAFHAAGVEVYLDVVFNHTGEGDYRGRTSSLRGIDNKLYYMIGPDGKYLNFSGCGNSLNVRHPRVLQLIMDSLRYWVLDMHVDGFRFDLASTLARSLHAVNRLAAFFDIIHQDPVLSRVKLIAEPWDVGEGGYQVGNFPVLWTEWNGKYRDSVRRFWKGDGSLASEFATRLAGSSDLYQRDGRKPYASINFITCHDGFTLQDLVSYSDKHNEANGEENRDGSNDNNSWNCGVEGPTDKPEVLELRERQKRNLIATLLLSLGVPLLLGGDEHGRTQRGNNNAYCQDNDISWVDWTQWNPRDLALEEFVKMMLRMRREHPAFKRDAFYRGEPIDANGRKDIAWMKPDGREMEPGDWTPERRTLGFFLGARPMLFVAMNAAPDEAAFTLPDVERVSWSLALDTGIEAGAPREVPRDDVLVYP
ncbi:MAG TPA: glycogen debranching protein GlgX, partial [Mycobacteriales bacterium]|nr:glycogen debranching protein GlgX [Mycobacteriales bacterium]